MRLERLKSFALALRHRLRGLLIADRCHFSRVPEFQINHSEWIGHQTPLPGFKVFRNAAKSFLPATKDQTPQGFSRTGLPLSKTMRHLPGASNRQTEVKVPVNLPFAS